MDRLKVTIGGAPFAHLLYHFVLTYSNWESVTICHSETFEALSEGLQNGLWRSGGVPEEHRTDNLSAATHKLKRSRGRGFTERYRELLDHYGLRASKSSPRRAHENGDIESSHGGLKNVVDQRLRLRGSREFGSIEAYSAFIDELIEGRNAPRAKRLSEERQGLRPLPVRALPAYRDEQVTVKRWSTIRVANKVYSLPSHLIGHRVPLSMRIRTAAAVDSRSRRAKMRA